MMSGLARWQEAQALIGLTPVEVFEAGPMAAWRQASRLDRSVRSGATAAARHA